MGNKSVKGMIQMDISNQTFQRLQEHYFGEAVRRDSDDTILCGAEALDNYKGTDTTNECTAIAGRDGEISAADLFIHHVLKEKLIPANMSRYLVAASNGTEDFAYEDEDEGNKDFSGRIIFVGLPLIKWILKKDGVTVTGKPKTQCGDASCTYYDGVQYKVNTVSAKNKNFRKFAAQSNYISARTVFNHFVRSVKSALDVVLKTDGPTSE